MGDTTDEAPQIHERKRAATFHLLAALPVSLPFLWGVSRRDAGFTAFHAKHALRIGVLMFAVLMLHAFLHAGLLVVQRLQNASIILWGSRAVPGWQRSLVTLLVGVNLFGFLLEYALGVVAAIRMSKSAGRGEAIAYTTLFGLRLKPGPVSPPKNSGASPGRSS